MTIRLLTFIYQITEGFRLRMLCTSVLSGSSRGMILATINTAAASTTTDHSLLTYITQFLFFLVVYLLSSYYVRVNSSALVEKARQKMTLSMGKTLLLAELSFVEGYKSSELWQRIRMDTNTVCGVADTLLSSSQALILLVFCLIYIAWLVPAIFFITLLAILVGVSVYFVQNKRVKETIRKARTAQVNYAQSLGDLLKGFKELKVSFKKRDNFYTDLESVSSEFRDLNVSVTRLETITYLTTQVFIYCLIGSVIFILPYFSVVDQTVMFQFFAAILFLIGPLETLVSSYQKITQANISYELVTEFESSIKAHASELADNIHKDGKLDFREIRLENACFEYRKKSADTPFVTGPINLTIKRGELLFIVGGNGSGKTTLLKLITGLYVPTSGHIYINGRKLELESLQHYRELFTTIFTDFHIFRKVYGHENVEMENFRRLMKDLNLDEKTSMENGTLSTVDGLSHGQRKRLAYVISFIDNRDIYVFDEFAADQDPNFKRYFYYTILPDLKALGKTVIAVTHDDNYFDACDRLIKVDNGVLVDAGDISIEQLQKKIVND